MKIGDIVYLAKPVEWRKTPAKIIGDSGFRGWDIEFIETGVKMLECRFVKFSSTPLK